MRAIKHVLTERFYAWEDAVKLAEGDKEIGRKMVDYRRMQDARAQKAAMLKARRKAAMRCKVHGRWRRSR